MLDCFSAVNQKIDELSKAVQNLSSINSGIQVQTRATPIQSLATPVEPSREKSVIVFGLPENQDSSVWRSRLMDVLKFAAGHTVAIQDAFRICAFSSHKVRPLVVKLRNIWDKRLLLSNSRNSQAAPITCVECTLLPMNH